MLENTDSKTKLVNELYAVQSSLRSIQKNMSDCPELQKHDIDQLILDLKSVIRKTVFGEYNKVVVWITRRKGEFCYALDPGVLPYTFFNTTSIQELHKAVNGREIEWKADREITPNGSKPLDPDIFKKYVDLYYDTIKEDSSQ